MAGCSCCSLRVLFIVLLVCVAFFILSFILAFVVFPDVVDSELKKNTRLEEGTEQFDRFMHLPFAVDFKINIFHIENPDEILNSNAKPIVVEKGPYVYKQFRQKTILSIDEEEDTISYTEAATYEFNAEASGNLTEDDLVTVLNAPLMSVYHMAEDLQLAAAVDPCFRTTFPTNYDKVFITVPIRQLLFEGYNFCRNKGNDMCALVNDLVCTIASSKQNSDILPDYSIQFSYLRYKTRPDDGKYVVKRGIDNIDTLGHIMAWNGMKYTSYWGQDTTCSEVKGTDSTIYPPGITTDSKFYIYATDVCRYVEIDYISEATYKDVDGYLFGTNPKTFFASTATPEEDCYCTMQTKNATGQKSCFLDGVVDLQSCVGAPILLSFPHFLWADEKYLNGVEGLSPDENIHKTFLIVEPNTGTPLQGVKRIQLNTIIKPIIGVPATKNMNAAVLPLLWIEEGVALPDKYVDELQTSYFDKVKLVEGFKWALIALSSVLLIIFGGLTIRKRFFAKSTNEDKSQDGHKCAHSKYLPEYVVYIVSTHTLSLFEIQFEV